MYVTARASASRDTAASAAVQKFGGNVCLARYCTWVSARFIEWVMDREKLSILVLRDLVLLAGPLVGAVDGVVVGFLMRLRVCAAMGYSPFVLL